jgi:hypothetical protein
MPSTGTGDKKVTTVRAAENIFGFDSAPGEWNIRERVLSRFKI